MTEKNNINKVEVIQFIQIVYQRDVVVFEISTTNILLAKLDAYRTYSWLEYNESVEYLQEQTEELLQVISL